MHPADSIANDANSPACLLSPVSTALFVFELLLALVFAEETVRMV